MGILGLIGIGRLGSAIAERLLAAGFTVNGHDTDPERLAAFAKAGGTPSIPRRCDRVILCLPSHAAVLEVTATLAEVQYIIDLTNAEPEQSETLAASLREQGIFYVDAPVCEWCETVRKDGGKVVCGGDQRAVEACHDIFEAFARPLIYAGPSGSGTRMKKALEHSTAS